jgi:hypothetical protein
MSGPRFTAEESSSGLPQPSAWRSTCQRCESCGVALPTGGRLDSKIMQEPSGAHVGELSYHSPENGATVGRDQFPLLQCDSMIIDSIPFGPLRVKYRVVPSGLNVGAPSLAGPEMTPGEKISGAAACGGSAPNITEGNASAERSRNRVLIVPKLSAAPWESQPTSGERFFRAPFGSGNG